jgi:protein pelota
VKIIEKNMKKDYVKLIPETQDDFWHLYNVILKNDMVYAHTTREMKLDEKYGRPKRGERISVFVGLEVAEVAWDKFMGKLRIHGTIREAPEKVPMGTHHTLSITLNMPLTIVKEHWTKNQIDRLEKASRTSEKPMIIVSIDDENYAIAETAQFGINVRVEERIKLPGKLEAEKRNSALNEYFGKVLSSMRRILSESPSPIVIIGVGFVKNDFLIFLKNEAPEIAESIVDVKSVNNGGTAGINEALRSGVLLHAMKELRIASETEAIEKVLKRLGKGETNVAYGFEEVQKAAEAGAIEQLMVADVLLRESPDEKRLVIESLMREVEEKRGEIIVVSTEHEAGAKLMGLSGLTALLRFSFSQNKS